MSVEQTFVELVFAGDATEADLDEFIERWHESDDGRPIHKYLGFSRDEYALWVEQPEALKFILFSKKFGVATHEAMNWNEAHLVAARSSSQNDAKLLTQWLQKTGRID